jgi:hypothetical protein
MKETCIDDCQFNQCFNPDVHVQRFCAECQAWYHEDCIEAVEDTEAAFEQMKEMCANYQANRGLLDLRILSFFPIARGQDVYGMSGNRFEQSKLRRLFDTGREEELEAWMAEEHMQDYQQSMKAQKWAFYVCKSCGRFI